MDNIKSLASLELAVDKLLTVISEMKQEQLNSNGKLEARDKEIEKLNREIHLLQGERNQIDQRITGLLGSINKWEELNASTNLTEESNGDGVGNTLF